MAEVWSLTNDTGSTGAWMAADLFILEARAQCFKSSKQSVVVHKPSQVGGIAKGNPLENSASMNC